MISRKMTYAYFFKKNPMPGTERILEQTLERVRIRSKFLRCIKKEFA